MHIPRAGGTALGSQIAQQTRLDPTFYFSFFGLDSSKGRNRIVVERLRKGDADHQALMRNRHFLESRVIMGHFSHDLATILEDFELHFATVVREPISRTISLIHQYTLDAPDRGRFADFPVPSKSREPDAYWAEVYRILAANRRGPIPGLLPHENLMLFNGTCRMIGGAPLHTWVPAIDFARVRERLPLFKLALFERFNGTTGAMMRELGIAVDLDERQNHAGIGDPAERARHARCYGAPEKVLDLVRAMNNDDLRLYELVASAIR
jgi:hypothetical protein